jgi:hypothetical protein
MKVDTVGAWDLRRDGSPNQLLFLAGQSGLRVELDSFEFGPCSPDSLPLETA